MPSLLEIVTAAQPHHVGALRAQSFSSCQALSTSSLFVDAKNLVSWKNINVNQGNNNSNNRLRRGKLVVVKAAVATLEPKTSIKLEQGTNGCNNLEAKKELEASWNEEEEKVLDEKEKLRRMKISKANKGNTPWNKGRKHSPETLQKIKERTKLAMQNPKVKMKLINFGHAQSKETREKIGVGVRMGWQKRRQKLMIQENIHFEWQNLIAEASRRGYIGEEELQWASYQILYEELQQEWLESVEQRKTMRKPKSNKRAPKSLEQRRKIAESIAAKWADPVYRERVRSGICKYHGTEVAAERRRRRKPSEDTQSTKSFSTKKKGSGINGSPTSEKNIRTQRVRLRSNKPLYKDPLANTKLEMIKNIRAQRAAIETKKTEAIERARLLIAEAEKAAKALEVAARTSPIAQASLIETRKLIAEAIHSIQSIDNEQTTSSENGRLHSLDSPDPGHQVEKRSSPCHEGLDQSGLMSVNGTHTLSLEKGDLPFKKFPLQGMLNGKDAFLASSSAEYSMPSINMDSFTEQSHSIKQPGLLEPNGKVKHEMILSGSEAIGQSSDEEEPSKPVTVTKKWVRGRLVEVTE